MSSFTTIDTDNLAAVSGGASGKVDVDVGRIKVGGQIDTATPPNPQASDPSAYLRCLDLVGKQAGMMESPANVAKRQQDLCGPLLNQ